MFYQKLILGWAFLFVSIAAPAAQWGSPFFTLNPDRSSPCRSLELRIGDEMGNAIAGATVTTLESNFQAATDFQGVAEIPTRCDHQAPVMIEVSAPAYETAAFSIASERETLTEVRLHKKVYPANAPELIVTSRELSRSAQVKSRDLQNEAAQAVAQKEYGRAKALLMEAMKLTPSAVSILSAIGVVEFYRKNLNAAGEWLEKAMQAAPYRAELVGKLGIVRWLQQRHDESYELLSRAAGMGYETGPGNYAMGVITLEKGRHAEAARYLKKASKTRFPYRELYLSLALRSSGRGNAAGEAFRSFLKHYRAPFAVSVLPGSLSGK